MKARAATPRSPPMLSRRCSRRLSRLLDPTQGLQVADFWVFWGLGFRGLNQLGSRSEGRLSRL